MTQGLQNRQLLDKVKAVELELEIFSFSGGENMLGADHELKSNEARVIKNWKATALGKMIRAEGFNEVADGGVTYTDQADLLIQHFEGTNKELYSIHEGDLTIKSGSDINQEDAAAFTSGLLTGGVSAGGGLWMTNQTDGLKKKKIGVAIATPSDTPANNCARIYNHKQRLIAEGAVTNTRRVFGSRGLADNWDASDAWSKASDAWNIDMPDDTQGCMPGFPSGAEIAVWTKFETFALFNFPNVAFRPIGPKSFGNSAPWSLAKGPEGVFFVSENPVLGVILWDGINFINLTENHDFVDKIDFSKRIYGVYRNREYILTYNETGSGLSYPHKQKIYDTRFGRWWEREVNPDLSDTFGHPALLTRDNNELYFASSQKDKIYEFESTDTDDEGNDTQADYKTKRFSSRDFNIATGGQFGIDNVKLKLVGMFLKFKSTAGQISVQWTADGGKRSGSRVIDTTAEGDLLNTTFTLGTSKLVTTPPTRTVFKTFANNAVGHEFDFQILNNGQTARPEIEKLKILAIAMEE